MDPFPKPGNNSPITHLLRQSPVNSHTWAHTGIHVLQSCQHVCPALPAAPGPGTGMGTLAETLVYSWEHLTAKPVEWDAALTTWLSCWLDLDPSTVNTLNPCFPHQLPPKGFWWRLVAHTAPSSTHPAWLPTGTDGVWGASFPTAHRAVLGGSAKSRLAPFPASPCPVPEPGAC